MSALQLQAYELIGQLSDTKLQLVIEIMKNFSSGSEVKQISTGKELRPIGLFKGEKYLADNTNIDEFNDEIAEMFGVNG